MVAREDNYQGSERRNYPRHKATVLVDPFDVSYVVVGKKDSKDTCLTQDISAGGVCLIVNEELAIDTIVLLTINLKYFLNYFIQHQFLLFMILIFIFNQIEFVLVLNNFYKLK